MGSDGVRLSYGRRMAVRLAYNDLVIAEWRALRRPVHVLGVRRRADAQYCVSCGDGVNVRPNPDSLPISRS